MEVVLDNDLLKQLKKLDVRIRKSVKERLLLFSKNPNDLQLNNHALKKEWQGHRSIDINAGYRAVYKEIAVGDEPVAYFVTLGTHDELYKQTKIAE